MMFVDPEYLINTYYDLGYKSIPESDLVGKIISFWTPKKITRSKLMITDGLYVVEKYIPSFEADGWSEEYDLELIVRELLTRLEEIRARRS